MEGEKNTKLQITNNKQIPNTKEPMSQTTGVNVTFRIPIWFDKICTWPVTAYRKHK